MLNVSSPEAKYAFFTGEGVGVKFKNYDPVKMNQAISRLSVMQLRGRLPAIGSSRYDEFLPIISQTGKINY